MKTSPAGLSLIKTFEGLNLQAYLCPAGVWTIGWGHTAGVLPGHTIDASQAEGLLAEDVSGVEADLPKVIYVAPTQGQWDALVSLCFNLKGGPRALPELAPRLLAKLHAGDVAGAADEFLDINRDAMGEVLPGLTRRRIAERLVFLS